MTLKSSLCVAISRNRKKFTKKDHLLLFLKFYNVKVLILVIIHKYYHVFKFTLLFLETMFIVAYKYKTYAWMLEIYSKNRNLG